MSNTNRRLKPFFYIAELCYCVIRYIEERKISHTIGLGQRKPPIKYMKDAGPIDIDLNDEGWQRFSESYKDYENYFDSIRMPS